LKSPLTASLHLWLERSARALVDFIAVQIAGSVALALIGFLPWWRATGQPAPTEAVLAHYYFHTFLPLSLVFPFMHAIFGLYTKLRGYTLDYKLRLAASSASVATLLLVFMSFVLDRDQLPRAVAVLFGVMAIGAAVGVRWFKDWLFHRESEARPQALAEVIPVQLSDTVLVVGGAGYIGSIVVTKLLERGKRVRLLDSLLYGRQAIEPVLHHPNLEFIKGDCRNIQDVVNAMRGVRSVIHLAAIVGDPACAAYDENAFQINFAATRMMLEVAQGYGVERFLFASSCSVYGASDSLMDENSETAPISVYAETKLHSERVLLEAQSATLHPTILRFATVFGIAPRPRFDLVVNLLTAKAIRDGVITIYNGEQWRPFIHVRDVAEAVVQTIEAPVEAVSGEIFNVGDDRHNFTLTQVAEKISALVPGTRVEHVENADRRNYRVSFAKFLACVGFRAQYTLEDGIAEIQRAFDTGLISDYHQAFYSNASYLRQRGHVNPENELDVKVMAAFAGAGNSSRSTTVSRTTTKAAATEALVASLSLEPDRSHLSSNN
jgi:nucleoside-diphosphate-sugar epimerase/succinate dehydrogenase hydrophobic anchor subunit